MVDEYKKASFEVRQKAVQKGAEVLKAELEAATPRSSESGVHMADCWEIKDTYNDHRYVGNTKNARGVVHRRSKEEGIKGEARENVPLSNVLEYAENSPHQGFIRRTFDGCEQRIYQAVKNTIKNGG